MKNCDYAKKLDFKAVSEKKTSNITSYFWTVPSPDKPEPKFCHLRKISSLSA